MGTVVKDALSGLRQFLATENPLKIMKKAFYFTLKALSWGPATLWKRDSNTGVYLWSLRNFLEQLLQNTSGGCFWPFL